jgi:hypothetical protein
VRDRVRRHLTRARAIAAAADLLLVAFLVALAFATAAQVQHNERLGPYRGAPHDKRVAAPGEVR